MNMTCIQITELLIDLHDGTLSIEQTEAFHRHVKICADCAVVVETYHVTIKITRSLQKSQPALPAGLEARLRAAVAQQEPHAG